MSAPQDIRPDLWAAMRGCRLWRGASEDVLANLARSTKVAEVRRGDQLVAEGDAAQHVGLVVAGRVLVLYMGADGKRITFEDLGVADPFGAVAALAGGRYPSHIEAATPGTIAWIDRETLFDAMAQEPEIARNLIADLASRVVNFTSVVQSMALDVPSRLARYLFQHSLAVGRTTTDGLRVDLGMSKADLAQALGTVPETLSRALGRLKDEGVLDVQGRTVIIRDVGALARLGSGYEEG